MTLGMRPLPEAAEASEFDVERSAGRRVDQLRPGDHVVIAGAGPAGLTAAYLLAKGGTRVTVLEADDVVGGIARTVEYRGYRFDIGGHRFFTKVAPVEALWRELLGDDFIKVPRLSRIHYRGRYFDYPLKAVNALRGLGLIDTVLVLTSYLRAHLWPSKVEETFEQWMCNRFGRRLYEIFFKTYTEKVWGIPCTEIRAEWAAQRIQGLSLAKAIWSATTLHRRSDAIKTLIHEFDYPRLGPGQMWERARDRVIELGGDVRTGHRVIRLERRDGRVIAVRARTPDGDVRITADHVITTMPVGELVRTCTPRAPTAVRQAGDRLSYRELVVVALIVRQRDLFPDNWIYIHTPGVRVSRIQNVNNWSRAMVPDPETSCVEMEYFCFEGDELWNMPDADLVALARRELGELGLADPSLVVDGIVVRTRKAYPVYDSKYRATSRRRARMARCDPEPAYRRSQRDAQVQQSGSLDADRDARARQHARRRPRLVGSEHGLRVPRDPARARRHLAPASPTSSTSLVRLATGPLPRRRAIVMDRPALSVIVPAHNERDRLSCSLEALRRSDLPRADWELIVVDDASSDTTADVARRYADHVVPLRGPRPLGPAYARNRGCDAARGEILVFIDADVCVHADTLRRFAQLFRDEPSIAAAFGSYDANPAAPGLVSQYRNLLHHYVHHRNTGNAETFWAGCGAVRRAVFIDADMFDEWHYPRPQVEDVELGGRIRALGHRIVLRPDIQATHLKRWSLWGMIRSDLFDRGVPWTRLLVQQGMATRASALNLKPIEKVKTALTCAAVACVALAPVMRDANWLVAAGVCLLAVIAGSLDLYSFFWRVRGWRFAAAVVPLHLMYYALNGISVGLGWLLHHAIGEPGPDPVIEAYAEVGVLSDSQLPSRRRRGAWSPQRL